ncbi:hypothetical protein Vretifemale_922, partial [Volvox reticuliferus]
MGAAPSALVNLTRHPSNPQQPQQLSLDQHTQHTQPTYAHPSQQQYNPQQQERLLSRRPPPPPPPPPPQQPQLQQPQAPTFSYAHYLASGPQHPVAATQQRPSPLVLQQQLQHQHQQLSHLTSEQLQQRRVAQVPPISTPTPQPPQQPLQPPQKQPSEPSEQPPQQQQQQRLPCFRGRLRLDSMLQSGPSSPYRDTPHRPQLTSPSQNCTAPAGNG